MPHFTYKTPNLEKLCQGDILARTEELLKILDEFHHHYSVKKDYLYFMVLTQSCDLVKREENDNRCSAQYITLAAIRPLELLIAREIRRYQSDDVEVKGRLVDRSKQNSLNNFIRRLLNNNETAYFYLNEDANMGLADSCVVFLRLSVPLKADLHYDTCLRAKKLELEDNFKAKLGWLVGDIYSRVATEDWTPNYKKEDQFKEMIEQILEANCVLIDNIKQFLKEVRSKYTTDQLDKMTTKELQKLNKEIIIPSRKQVFLDRLEEVLLQTKNTSDKAVAKEIVESIKNDAMISALLK
jgi:hypothetical protein